VIAASKIGFRLERWVWLILVTSVTFAAPSQIKPLEFKSGLLTVTIHDPRDKAHLKMVFGTFQKAQADLEALGLEVKAVRLEAFENAAGFAKATGEPFFVAASTLDQTILTQRLGALQARGLLSFTIRHEVFHTAQPASLPRWLAEGLARHFSGEDARDSLAPSGLEFTTNTRLNELLAARKSRAALNLVYLEATRRAKKRVRMQGWKRTLAQK
jgi:hypothetical protein